LADQPARPIDEKDCGRVRESSFFAISPVGSSRTVEVTSRLFTQPATIESSRTRASSSWRSCFSICWCRTNRFLPCPESLADLPLRVLQEFVGPTQGFSAAVQHPASRFLYR